LKVNGYYIEREEQEPENPNITHLSVVPEHDLEVSNKVKNIWLWHVVPSNKVANIMKKGLSPRMGCKMNNHPDRLYLTYSKDTVNMLLNNPVFTGGVSDFTILAIYANPETGYRYFIDQRTPDSVYTLDTISSEYIRVSGKVQLNEQTENVDYY
jgi:hypothetical protein